jgi:hypothetical protein
MPLSHLALKRITNEDLTQLVADQIRESKTIEFKQHLNLEGDKAKVEFLSDITAFANTDGGDLVYGIADASGCAGELVGMRNLDLDSIQQKIENLLRTWVQPRIRGIEFHPISLDESGSIALVIRIPKSIDAPHLVKMNGGGGGPVRFCGRNSNGKFDLDINEIRSSLLETVGRTEALREFRRARINQFIACESPVQYWSTTLLVLHVLPMIGATRPVVLTTEDLVTVSTHQGLRPIDVSNFVSGQFNFDGLISRDSSSTLQRASTVQIFRNGYVEAVNCTIIQPQPDYVFGPMNKMLIFSSKLQIEVRGAFSRYIDMLKSCGIRYPFVVSMSLIRVKGYGLAQDPGRGSNRIDRDHLLMDEQLLESESQPLASVLDPMFDQLWNACGWEAAPRET